MRTLLVLSLAGTLLAASAGCRSCRTLWGSAGAPAGPPVVSPGPVPATTYSGGPASAVPPSLPVVTQPVVVAPAPYAGGAPAPLPMLSGPQNYTPITGR